MVESLKMKKSLLVLCMFVTFIVLIVKIGIWNNNNISNMKFIAERAPMNLAASSKASKSAFRKLGFADMKLMRKLDVTRSSFNFSVVPWKTGNFQTNLNYGQKWSMIVGIKSHIRNFGRRNAIRSTWGSYKQFRGVRLEVIFAVAEAGDPDTELQFLKENKKHGDLLQIARKEVYKYVGLKTIATMQWVGEHFPPDWIFSSADDDMMPNLITLYDEIELLMSNISSRTKMDAKFAAANIPMHCAFSLRDKRVPIRNQRVKNSVPKELYSEDKYPTFCAGGFYSMPVKLSTAICSISRQHKYYIMDDVWITGLLRLSVVDSQGYFDCDITDQYCAISKNSGHSVAHLSTNPEKFVEKWREFERTIRK